MRPLFLVILIAATLASCALQPVRQLDDLGHPSEFERRLRAEQEAFEIRRLADNGQPLPLPR